MPKTEQHGAVIQSVEPGSIAEEAGLQPGDRILRVNGRELRDVLDYQVEVAEEDVDLEFQRGDECGLIQIEKYAGEGLGLEMGDVVFDGVKQCANRCVFCFIHQNPKGMRETIWVRDDDYRLSFLEGHFITLTNLSPEEWRRILEGHMSPMRVSVHATDPEVRTRMILHKDAGKVMDQIRQMVARGIEVHAQAVLCPGWNDGEVLDRTITDLAALYPGVGSLAIVPVGLTRFRRNLPDLKTVTSEMARDVIKQVGAHQRALKKTLGTRFVFLGDEFYLQSGVALPKYTEYDGFPALDDGVGTCRWWDHRWRTLRKTLTGSIPAPRRVTVITGELAGPVLQPAIDRLNEVENASVTLVPVKNEFYGGGINVTGLVTGSDVLRALEGMDVGDELILPEIMVRQGRFLDDVTLADVEAAIGRPARVVETSPKGLMAGVLG
ncbi:MAG TPA: DUF512 domain-containing protein [Armatimonadota bacterium]|jgi:putative radical SAM enzyme (TIGR03279 family)